MFIHSLTLGHSMIISNVIHNKIILELPSQHPLTRNMYIYVLTNEAMKMTGVMCELCVETICQQNVLVSCHVHVSWISRKPLEAGL